MSLLLIHRILPSTPAVNGYSVRTLVPYAQQCIDYKAHCKGQQYFSQASDRGPCADNRAIPVCSGWLELEPQKGRPVADEQGVSSIPACGSNGLAGATQRPLVAISPTFFLPPPQRFAAKPLPSLRPPVLNWS